jgi:riboflavin kinase/FMN adenylyltransferase
MRERHTLTHAPAPASEKSRRRVVCSSAKPSAITLRDAANVSRRCFTALVTSGRGRGRKLGIPTLNLDLRSLPGELAEGVYAVRVQVRAGQPERSSSDRAGEWRAALLHYGPRPTFGDTKSCEVHLLKVSDVGFQVGGAVTVEVMQRLRDVQRFESEEALKAQIAKDRKRARETCLL